MKYACVAALVLLLAVSSYGARNYQQDFVNFMHKHEKSYAHDEFFNRFNIFKANVDKIDAHNAKGLSWTMGVNKFSDLTAEEFKAIYTGGLKVPRIRVLKNTRTLSTVNLPSEVDWVKAGAVTDVKDQGQCGSCWSFSTTGSLEGLYFKQHNSLSPIEPSTSSWTQEGFSEQMLVDCSGSAGNNGCEGGLMDDAFTWVGQNGIDLEAKYAYTAQDGSCSESSGPYMKGISFSDVTASDEDALKAAVANQPVSVAIEADQDIFQSYSGGVINDAGACGTQLDHGVLAVGYGHDASSGLDFWKVKNSWGADWGMNGYVLLARGSGSGNPGMCGIALMASYPTSS